MMANVIGTELMLTDLVEMAMEEEAKGMVQKVHQELNRMHEIGCVIETEESMVSRTKNL